MKERVPTWLLGPADFQSVVRRVQACWKHAKTNCDFCGDGVLAWQHEGWCRCQTHWPVLFMWVQQRSVGGFPDGLKTTNKRGLAQLVQMALLDQGLQTQLNRVMDNRLCCSVTKVGTLTYGCHKKLTPSLGDRQGICNQCRSAAQHLVREKMPAALAMALKGTAETEWNAVQDMDWNCVLTQRTYGGGASDQKGWTRWIQHRHHYTTWSFWEG